MPCVEKSFTGNADIVEYTGTVSGYRYSYDKNNNLTRIRSNMDGKYWNTYYTYDEDNRPSQITLSNGKTIEYVYGKTTGRPDYITRHLDTDYVVDWTYKSGANGSSTTLISTYSNGSDARYNYNYDANGNITQIWRGSVTFAGATEKYSYVYDAANQLIRENLYYGSGNAENATYTYSYDKWGNILSKSKYAYTTGTLGTIQSVISYCSYGNSQWKDQLTSYNGQSITYDASGNPINYLGATLVWEGQRLKSYTPVSTGSGKVNSYTYNYDENGLRTQKTVNGIKTSYYYNGSILMGMTIGTGSRTQVLRFSYDANGNVVAADYSTNNGSTFNTYYYLRNAQGDVVKLIDKTGATVVEYAYDSWGKPLSTTGSLASTLGKYNPFRYRGYVYDEETGWYYLQSRYYNPEVGRFISPDVYLSTGQGVLGHNAYAYCDNNSVVRADRNGQFWDYVIDIGFLVWSVFDVVNNPGDWKNWAALAVDVVFAVVPFVPSGAGQVIKAGNKIDNALDIANAINKVDNIQDAAKVTMIGRNMNRVTSTANLIGTADNLYEAWKGYDATATGMKKILHNGISMAHNGSWLFGKLRQGYTVIDIGLSTMHKGRGLWYGTERFVLGLWETRNIWKLPINYCS